MPPGAVFAGQAAGAAGEKQFTAYRQQGNHQRAADHLRDIPLPEAVDQKTSQPAQTGIGRDHRRGDKLNQRRAHTGEDQRRLRGQPDRRGERAEHEHVEDPVAEAADQERGERAKHRVDGDQGIKHARVPSG